MTTYIHELPDWPNFRWDQGGLAKQLAAVRLRQGRLIGRMQALEFRQQEEAVLTTLTEDVLKSSEIEGEILDKDQVRSSKHQLLSCNRIKQKRIPRWQRRASSSPAARTNGSARCAPISNHLQAELGYHN
jgi:Fic family protein